MSEELQIVSARLHMLTANTPNKIIGVKDESYSVKKIDGFSALNEVYEYNVDFVSHTRLDLKDITDTDVKISLRDGKNKSRKRFIYGKVYKIEELPSVAKKRIYRIKVVHPFYYLNLNKHYKIYQNMKVVDIISEIVLRYSHILNIEINNKLDEKTFPEREICTQYGQSDAEFIQMLSQEERFSIGFDSTREVDKNSAIKPYTMVLTNINEHYKSLDEEFICSYNLSKKFTTTSQVENYFDFENPSRDYKTEAGKNVANAHIQDNDITTAKLRVDLKVETIRDRLELLDGARAKDLSRYVKVDAINGYSNAEMIKGSSESIFTEDSYCLDLYERKTDKKINAIIISTKINANFPNALDEHIDTKDSYYFSIDFEAVPSQTIFISKDKIEKPKISGIQTALVSSGSKDTLSGENNIEVDQLGRIKVIFHFDNDKPTTCFVRLATMFSGNNWGSQFLPRVNTEVIVSFVNGDIDKPIIVGSLYNGKNKIPKALPDSKTQSYIKTQSMPQHEDEEGYNELLFEDKNSEELLSLRAQKDYKLHAQHDSQINIDNDEATTIGNDRTEDVGNNETLTVGGSSTETVMMNKAENIRVAKALTIGAGYQTSVGGAKNETVGMSSTEQVGILKHIIAGKRFELQVGDSSLVLNSDGTIVLKGNEILIEGSSKVTVNGKVVEIN